MSLSPQLRLAVVQALGPMSNLLPSEKLEEQLPKLLPGVLALYKRHAETCHVSKVRPLHPPAGGAGVALSAFQPRGGWAGQMSPHCLDWIVARGPSYPIPPPGTGFRGH